MTTAILFSLIGYLCGSILFADIFAKVFHKNDIVEQSKDHNPGTSNAYRYGGFWCGTCTLCGDLLKGFIPIHILTHIVPIAEMDLKYAPVLALPVVGHIFPIFKHFRGGKGIAVTFGCFLGLFPYALPFFIFAANFIFFTAILRVSPHFYLTIVAYICTFLSFVFIKVKVFVYVGFLIIVAAVCFKLHISKEEREKIKVRAVWMH